MADFYSLNYPIETEKALQFWSSSHKLNNYKAVVAFSLDLSNANDNLRRMGVKREMRKRILSTYVCYVNEPTMASVPFSPENTPPDTDWREELDLTYDKSMEEVLAMTCANPNLPLSITLGATSIEGIGGNTVAITIANGSGNYHYVVKNLTANLTADDVTQSTPYSYTFEEADKAGNFEITVTDANDATKAPVKATFTVTVPTAPVFAADGQPDDHILYQEGGKLEITGVKVAPVTGYQWQKQSGTTWADVAGATSAVYTKASGANGDDGKYRVIAKNGLAQTISDEIDVHNVYLGLQNDYGNTAGNAQTVKVDDYDYTFTVTAPYNHTIQFSAFLKSQSNDQNFDPDGSGPITSRQSKVIWTHDDPNHAVIPSNPPSGGGNWSFSGAAMKAGTVNIVATVGNLSSKLKLVVN